MLARKLLWLWCVVAGCGGGRGVSARGVCADTCARSCGGDRDCDSARGELCCDFRGSGKACVAAGSCPRFCSGDGQCDTQAGQACVRTTLASSNRICASPQAAIKTCSADASCGSGEVCCGIYAEPICLPATECPKPCAQSSECTAGGTICCTTLALTDNTLSVTGLCIDPYVVACPTACQQSSDCHTERGELCCDGICSTSCAKHCDTSSECNGQICCDSAVLDSPFTKRRSVGYSTASSGS